MGIHRRREMHTAVNGGGIVFEYSGIYDALYFASQTAQFSTCLSCVSFSSSHFLNQAIRYPILPVLI